MKYQYLSKKLDELFEKEDYSIIEETAKIFVEEVKKNPEDRDAQLIANCLSMYLNADDQKEPYKPLLSTPQGRTFSLEDINEDDALYLFSNIKNATDNLVILSRIFDVLWITKKLKKNNPDAGEYAALYWKQYLDKLIEYGYFHLAAINVKRYIFLCLSLPHKSVEAQQFVEQYKKWIQIPKNENTEFFIRQLYSLYLENVSFGNENAGISKVILKNAEDYITDNFDASQEAIIKSYVYVILRIYKSQNNTQKWNETWIKFKDYYLKAINPEMHILTQIRFLQQAISCLRKIPGGEYKNEIEQLQYRIENLQPKIYETMHTMSSNPIDISEFVYGAIRKISGKDLFSALKVLFNSMSWVSKEYIEHNKYESIIDNIVHTVQYNSRWRPQNTSQYSMAEKRCISIFFDLEFCRCNVLPMLQTFREEHFITYTTLLDITSNHPIIPFGYEMIYSKGLYYYLLGDYLEAAYLLIPAFENSLRYMVSQKHPTSYFKKDDIAYERIKIDGLINILEEDKIIQPVIALNLRYFFGANDYNLRNDLMHGLLTFNQINSIMIISGLSLIYWMVMYPFCIENKMG